MIQLYTHTLIKIKRGGKYWCNPMFSTGEYHLC